MLRAFICLLVVLAVGVSSEIDERPVVIRLQPRPQRPNFLKEVAPPHAVGTLNGAAGTQKVIAPKNVNSAKVYSTHNLPAETVQSQVKSTQASPEISDASKQAFASHTLSNQPNQEETHSGQFFKKQPLSGQVFPSQPIANPALPGLFGQLPNNNVMPGLPASPLQLPQTATAPQIGNIIPPAAQQPIMTQPPIPGEQFSPREITTIPPPPPVNIPPDVQNQLIKFFGLDSFGIPGLTGNHPEGFAGAIDELRKAGIPIQGIPPEHLTSTAGGANYTQSALPHYTPQSDAVARASPTFGNALNQLYSEAAGPTDYHAGLGSIPLPEAVPGENGLIGLLSSSVRKLVHDSGIADAMSQGIPTVLGTNKAATPEVAHSTDTEASEAEATAAAASASTEIRRQPSAAQKALSGLAAALGGNSNGPTHAGLPRIPGIPLLPGGIPRNAQGQIDVVQLIGSITRRITNGTTVSDIIPPEQLQTLADNVTDALLPPTPEDFDLQKFMGRWFEGINSPRATEQRCIVHHYGGLTKNDKTATFTALKIYREGSEFGPVRYSIGYAFRGGNKNAMLQLHSSESADAQPFWVYKLGPEGTDPFGNSQYEWAIVSNWLKYPVTVLVRDPDTFKTKYEVDVLRWLEDQGFINGFIRAFNMLQPASYSSCQYADSTFTVFGPSKRSA